jgi:hypothetical protein
MKGEQIAGIEDLLLRVPSSIVFERASRNPEAQICQ